MTEPLPDGTRTHLPGSAAARSALQRSLHDLYAAWGYRAVEVPMLERYEPAHPRARQAFAFADRDGGLLTLRSDFTPALARLAREAWPHAADPDAHRPVRLQVAGPVWHAAMPELARTREFTQVGVELIGVRHPRADAELIHLARESVRRVGLRPRVEIGSPGFVRALMDEAEVPRADRPGLADAIDRKDVSDVVARLGKAGAHGPSADAIAAVPDLYGSIDRLDRAEAVATGAASRAALAHLRGVLEEFEDASELILDLGMARRLSYYTGVTFRAYTVDFGQPLLGGGRYDGAWLPYAAGFALGLERLAAALPAEAAGSAPARVASLDDHSSRLLRAAGIPVVRPVAADPDAARAEARGEGAAWLVRAGGTLEALAPNPDDAERARLSGLLEGDDA